jgi:hypothetical protein
LILFIFFIFLLFFFDVSFYIYIGATVVATMLTQVLILSYERYQELLLDGTIEKKTHETLAKLSASYKKSD